MADEVKERHNEEFVLESDVEDNEDDLEESKAGDGSSSSSNYNSDDDGEGRLGGPSTTFTSQQWPQSFK